MMYRALIALLTCGLACAAESFESCATGAVSKLQTEYGALTAEPGHAEVLGKLARTGNKTLHIMGGKNRVVQLGFEQPLEKEATLSFWMERWTKANPFDFRLVADTPQGEVQLLHLQNMAVKGYTKQVQVALPAGTTAVRLLSTTAEKGGVLVDDLQLDSEPMVVQEVKLENPGAYPMLKRAPINPVMRYKVTTTGALNPVQVQKVHLRVSPADAIEEVTLRTGNADGTSFRNSVVLGKGKPDADGTVRFECDGALQTGENILWVDATPSATAKVGTEVTFANLGISIAGKRRAEKTPRVKQRIGYYLAVPGEEVLNPARGGEARPCVSFRIPGLIRTQEGTLIGCFDARYRNKNDLCEDIDVAMVRSEDGGQTWSLPTVNMDAGPGADNGCGDPCILQDTATGRIWMQALACHFNRGPSIRCSSTGTDPAKTGQWEMVYSDDDGKTWSSNVNVTTQIKKDEWTLILAGPGCGICTSQGVLVFPAQIWDTKKKEPSQSTICYSEDNGKTWHYGEGVPYRSSECQVVELADGSLMLTCRNEQRTGKRAIFTTKDLGKTWQAHPTHLAALQDCTCQASLVAVDSPKYGRLLLYSHPNSPVRFRNTMTLRVSRDEGKTWSPGYVYDSRECWGYSCIAMVDDEHVCIIYESTHVSESSDMHGIGFIIVPLKTVLDEKE